MSLLAIWVPSLDKCLQLNCLMGLFHCCCVIGVLYILWILIFHQIYNCKDFLPLHGLPFHFVDSALCWKQFLIMVNSNVSTSVFFIFGDMSKKLLQNQKVLHISAVFFKEFHNFSSHIQISDPFVVNFFTWFK